MKVLLTIVIILMLFVYPTSYANALGVPSTTPDTSTNTSKPGCGPIDITQADYVGYPFENPESIQSQDGLLETTLKVKYGDNKIADCEVHLRSYNGKLVGPTLRVKPGDTIRIKLINDLPPQKPEAPEAFEAIPLISEKDCSYELATGIDNHPHDFNVTNFHTHGLHVDPNACSDNVLRVMKPKQKDGDSPPEYLVEVRIPNDHPAGTFWYHAHLHGSTALQVSSGMAGALIVEGGLDEIPPIKAADKEEKMFVFQQISYDNNGEIENYDDFGPSTWAQLGRHTTINGQIIPIIKMRPGEVQRWRFIHAGVRETLSLELRNTANNRQIPLNEIAVDGIVLDRLDSWNNESVELNPGYRSDVLVQAPPLGENQLSQEYDLSDKPSPKKKSLRGEGELGAVLAKVIVEGEPMDMSLPTDAQLAEVKEKDAPKDITDSEITEPSQSVTFSVNQKSPNFTVDGQSFDPKQARVLHLNKAQIWNLETDQNSLAPNHPFHIHVNPFQVDRLGPNNKTERIWRDTLLIKKGSPQQIRSRYTDFTGRFVLHCHILDHEDQGMMQVVEVDNQL